MVLARFLWFRKHLRTVGMILLLMRKRKFVADVFIVIAPKLLSSRRRRLLIENGVPDVEDVDDATGGRGAITKNKEMPNGNEKNAVGYEDGRLRTQD